MSTTYAITLPADHDYLASLPDGTHDELVLRSDGVAVLTERVGKVDLGTLDWLWDSSALAMKAAVTEMAVGVRLISQALCTNYKYGGCVSRTEMVTESQLYINAKASVIFVKDSNYTLSDKVKFTSDMSGELVYYKVAVPSIQYSADNGTTWSTTDPTAGTSAIPLRKGTNNVWCTDRLSPEVALDYVQDTNKVINELRAAIVASGATS